MKDQSHDVVIRSDGIDHFTAQVVAFPELRSEAATEEEAVEILRKSLGEFLEKSKLTRRARFGLSGKSRPQRGGFAEAD